ncbi:MAG: mechanosensitive ion channel family protein [Vicinamibacteria bacterium]|nr:mechanosensitive ion channel family protein [Vicinamibacteria bacterium]
MLWIPSDWPVWLSRLAWTLVTVAGAWVLGRVANALVVRSLVTWAGRTRATWDDAIWEELNSRLPTWAMLLGGWLAIGHWTLNAQAELLATRALFVAGAVSVTLALAAVASRLVGAFGSSGAPGHGVTSLSRTVTWGLVATLGMLVILNTLGVSIAPMLTALGIGGLAVALALQEPLANLFAGLFITMAGQIRVGDYVKLDSGMEGYVMDFGWRSTRIRMLANNLVLVPNAKLAQAVVVNYHLPARDLAVLVDVGVDYASDLQHVERVTRDVAGDVMATVAGGVPDFAPFVRFHTFADSSINFSVILRGQEFTDQYLVKHEFIKRLHRRYQQEGIAIPFPMRSLTLREAPPVGSASGESPPPASA